MTQGSNTRVRDRILPIRLSAEEHAVIRDAAGEAGLAVGSYARQVLLGAPAPREVRRKPVNSRELVRLLGALGHIGGNLNQLARDRNTGLVVPDGDIALAARAVVEMRDAVMTALGREP